MIGRRTPPPEPEQTALRGFDDFDLRLGDIMRGERATLGKSLLDVQRDLKIKATYIAAIENADPSVFETPGFIAGYVRSYARYLGMDPEWAFGRFCEESGFTTPHGMIKTRPKTATGEGAMGAIERDPLAEPRAAFVPGASPFWERLEPGAIGSVLVLLMLAIVIGYGGFSVFRAIQQVQIAADESPAALAGPGGEIAAQSPARPDTAPTIEALDRLYRPQALEVPRMVARDAPISTLDPMQVGTLSTAASRSAGPPGTSSAPLAPRAGEGPSEMAAAQAGAAPAAPGSASEGAVQVLSPEPAQLRIFAVRPSWVRVRRPDGTVLFEKILDVGEYYTVPREEEAPPLLRTGNAGSVYIRIGNQTYGPVGSGPTIVKNLPLAAETLAEAYPVADPKTDGDLARFLALAQAEREGAAQQDQAQQGDPADGGSGQ